MLNESGGRVADLVAPIRRVAPDDEVKISTVPAGGAALMI